MFYYQTTLINPKPYCRALDLYIIGLSLYPTISPDGDSSNGGKFFTDSSFLTPFPPAPPFLAAPFLAAYYFFYSSYYYSADFYFLAEYIGIGSRYFLSPAPRYTPPSPLIQSFRMHSYCCIVSSVFIAN